MSQKNGKNPKQLICSVCNFEAKTFRGLQIHRALHKKKNANSKTTLLPSIEVAKEKSLKNDNRQREFEEFENLHHSKNIILNRKLKR
jgi:hypothetical protein